MFNIVIENLLNIGKDTGYLTYDEIDEFLDHYLDYKLTEEKMKKLYDNLKEEGIKIVTYQIKKESDKKTDFPHEDRDIQKALAIKERIKERKQNFKPQIISSNTIIKSSFDYFMEDLQSIPEISQIEETQALALLTKHGNTEARNLLVEGFIRIVLNIAKEYYLSHDILDLIQEGCIGLIEAAEKFDININKNFHGIGFIWARQSINRAIADQSKIIRIPVHMFEKINKLKNIIDSLWLEMEREPDIEEIAQQMFPWAHSQFVETNIKALQNKEKLHLSFSGQLLYVKSQKSSIIRVLTTIEQVFGIYFSTYLEYTLFPLEKEQVRQIIKIMHEPFSLETYIDEDTLLRDHIEPFDPLILEDVANFNLLKLKIQDIFNENEIQTLYLRLGCTDEISRTLKETGEVVGLSRERIRQIQLKASNKLRYIISRNKILRTYWEENYSLNLYDTTAGKLATKIYNKLFLSDNTQDLKNREYCRSCILNFLRNRKKGVKAKGLKHFTLLKEIIEIILKENDSLSIQEIYSETLDYGDYSEASISWCLTKHTETFIKIGDKWNLTEKILSNYSSNEEDIQTEFLQNKIKEFNDKYREAIPEKKQVISEEIERPNIITHYLKKSHDYTCQICNIKGFLQKNGTYYIEAHHIEELHELAKGSYCSDNIIIVCPTCHRKLHFANIGYIIHTNDKIKFKINDDTFEVQRNIFGK